MLTKGWKGKDQVQYGDVGDGNKSKGVRKGKCRE